MFEAGKRENSGLAWSSGNQIHIRSHCMRDNITGLDFKLGLCKVMLCRKMNLDVLLFGFNPVETH